MATPPSPEVKAQHYIPKLYLKGFTDSQKRLWVCEKFEAIRSSKPRDEAHRPDYYTCAERGQRDETAENILMQVESKAAPIICKMANPQYLLSPENAGHLMMFVAFMFARVPSWREHLDNLTVQLAKNRILRVANNEELFHQTCLELEKEGGKSLCVDIEKLRQDVLKDRFYIRQSTAFNLGSMSLSACHIAKIMATMSYQAFYAPQGKFFVTSDSPVYTIRPDGTGEATVGMGFGWENVEVYFPINKRTCFRMKRGIRPMGKTIEAGRVDEINRVTMATAIQYLYSSEGHRRIARLFDEHGCKVRVGKNAFMTRPRPPGQSPIRMTK
jgi:Protein of unknown function (DUF4238)